MPEYLWYTLAALPAGVGTGLFSPDVICERKDNLDFASLYLSDYCECKR